MDYLISRERFLKEVEQKRHHNKGIINWFVGMDYVLNVIYEIDNVSYIYRVHSILAREDAILKMVLLELGREILGIAHGGMFEEKELPKAEPIPEVANANNN